jgi:hypothetical protein
MTRLGVCAVMLALIMLTCVGAVPQLALPGAAPPEAQPEAPKDVLGRITPRGGKPCGRRVHSPAVNTPGPLR